MPATEGRLDRAAFEQMLVRLCDELTAECVADGALHEPRRFEQRVRGRLAELARGYGVVVDPAPHPYGFPDVVVDTFGVEVKYAASDSWRSVANSIFERHRNRAVEHIYVVFGKIGGTPEVRWRRYGDCVMHVRTSHVPRFELDMSATESLFVGFGLSYEEFSRLSELERMDLVRNYARSRLEPGERLWWLEAEGAHSLPLNVELFANLAPEEKLKMRAEASLLCPQIVGSSRNRTKYTDPLLFLLTYRGVLATRDAFSAGSVAGEARGGIYVMRALQRIQPQMEAAAQYLEPALFEEYWGAGEDVAPGQRIGKWLRMADSFAARANPAWRPSRELFLPPT